MEHPSKSLHRIQQTPKKHLSQNFLVNTHSLEGLENLFDSDEILLEIGPGLGAVTEYFLDHNFNVVLCEKDFFLFTFLYEKYGHYQGISPEVIHADFLKQPVEDWQAKGVSGIVSNLPFHLSTQIIMRIIKNMPFINKCLWGLQKEVAYRLCSKEKSSSLSLFLRAYGHIYMKKIMKKNSFYPLPRVDASWVFWERNQTETEFDTMELLLRSVFWGKRKTVLNSLKRNPHMLRNDHDRIPIEKWRKKINGVVPKEIKAIVHRRADSLSIQDCFQLLEWFQH